MSKKVRTTPVYQRKETYSVEAVLSKRVEPYILDAKSMVDFDGDLMRMNSSRYQVFDIKGLKCSFCNLTGSFFAKEKTGGIKLIYHFNLYAINEFGEEVLMTKDHIIAKSLGGINHIDNYQTACTKCNGKKASLSQEEFLLKRQ